MPYSEYIYVCEYIFVKRFLVLINSADVSYTYMFYEVKCNVYVELVDGLDKRI